MIAYPAIKELVGMRVPEQVLRHFGWTTDMVTRYERALCNLDTISGPSLAILSNRDLLRQYRSQQGN